MQRQGRRHPIRSPLRGPPAVPCGALTVRVGKWHAFERISDEQHTVAFEDRHQRPPMIVRNGADLGEAKPAVEPGRCRDVVHPWSYSKPTLLHDRLPVDVPSPPASLAT